MSNLNHVDMFVADLEAFNDNDEDLIMALKKFQVLYRKTRLVIVALGYELPNELLSRIAEEKIHNIIADAGESITQDISLALSSNGMTENESNRYLLCLPNEENEQEEKSRFTLPKISLPKFPKKEKTLLPPKQKPQVNKPVQVPPVPKAISHAPVVKELKHTKKQGIIRVGICGTQSRIGTTHQALMLCAYINRLRFKSAYLETGSPNITENISHYYHTTTNKAVHLTQFGGVDMFTDYQIAVVMALPYDVFVFDYGTLAELDIKEFLSNDVKIIVGGSKAWELPYFQTVFDELMENPDLQFIFSFTDKNDQESVKDLMLNYKSNTYFSDYTPSPYDSKGNDEVYRRILSDYIRLE